MTLEDVRYHADSESEWDSFCADSINGTFLHTRRFLSYHGERFIDASVLLRESGQCVGVFPAALAREDNGLIASHPGATYGGVVHNGRLAGNRMLEAVAALKCHYRQQGAHTLLYKAIPHIYAKSPAQDDSYALFRHQAQRVRCDLSCTVDLGSRRPPSERRRRGLKKASKYVVVSRDASKLPELWTVLEDNLQRRHTARPVHSLEEIQVLVARFPKEIQVRCALSDGAVVAGVVLFNANRVWHAQYIAASERGHEVSALDAVFESIIAEADDCGVRYFDFGTSNEHDGQVLNDGLYRFKHEFGGGGTVHEFYRLALHE